MKSIDVLHKMSKICSSTTVIYMIKVRGKYKEILNNKSRVKTEVKLNEFRVCIYIYIYEIRTSQPSDLIFPFISLF